jgi:hypothetical protein
VSVEIRGGTIVLECEVPIIPSKKKKLLRDQYRRKREEEIDREGMAVVSPSAYEVV